MLQETSAQVQNRSLLKRLEVWWSEAARILSKALQAAIEANTTPRQTIQEINTIWDVLFGERKPNSNFDRQLTLCVMNLRENTPEQPA